MATNLQDCAPGSATIAPSLLDWYDRHHRSMPWRVDPADGRKGILPKPYHVWLSEVMLQQTTVEAVKEYFRRFLERWPDITALAGADEDEVLKAWAGLGYYSRARNLKKTADIVARDHGGVFPASEEGLKALPGIGEYTAAAIAAFAFGTRALVLDGNIERVVARLFSVATPLPAARKELRSHLEFVTPAERSGDFAQGMMDLGATICTPKKPSCLLCPLREHCQAFAEGRPEAYPVKPAKRTRPRRRGAAFVAVRPDGAVWLRQRAGKGMLAAMMETPSSAWSARQDGDETTAAAPFKAPWHSCGEVAHIFTHFELSLRVFKAEVTEVPVNAKGRWSDTGSLEDEALPTLFRKVLAIAGIPRISAPEGK